MEFILTMFILKNAGKPYLPIFVNETLNVFTETIELKKIKEKIKASKTSRI
jgi:hypothetical protein